jgi:RNA polymerase sigma-70 factor (ECF subfamily)
MADPADDFASLLARARQWDQAALAELVRRYEPEVRRVAHAQLGPALRPYLESMDLVNSVHRSLLLGLRQNKFALSAQENLVALAVVMVRRKIARHWRKVQKEHQQLGHKVDVLEVEEILTSLSESLDDPARAAEHRDQIRQLFRELDPTDQQLVKLRLEGASTAQTARTLGLDADVLRVRLSRLRKRLHARGVFTEWL